MAESNLGNTGIAGPGVSGNSIQPLAQDEESGEGRIYGKVNVKRNVNGNMESLSSSPNAFGRLPPVISSKPVPKSARNDESNHEDGVYNMYSQANNVQVMGAYQSDQTQVPNRESHHRAGNHANHVMEQDAALLDLQEHLIAKNAKKDQADHREVIINMENIQKTYLLGIEGVTAVRGVDLQVRRGEFLLILGTSGGGKSSLLNIMGTIDTPSRGNLKLFGEYMRSSTQDSEYARIRLEKIGFVFQSFNLIGTMTATENVELPMLLNGRLKRDEIRARAQNLLKEVGLEKRLNHYPNMLSGGEQQRVTIARALSNNPELLLMDEPTGDLDTKNADIVVNILVDLNQKHNISMVMVTHDEYMKQYAHRVIHIMDGKISREEKIDPAVNEEAYAKIRATVQSYRDGTAGEVGVREGAEANGQMVGITETRSLGQYPFVRYMMEQVQKQKNKQKA